MNVQTPRGEVYLRTTAPGLVIASWYPRSQTDTDWPGVIVAASEASSFPLDAWNTEDGPTIREWLQTTYPAWFQPTS